MRLFVHSLSPNRYHPVYLSLTHVDTSGSLLKLLVTSLGETPRRGKERLSLQVLQKVEKSEPTTLVIVTKRT